MRERVYRKAYVSESALQTHYQRGSEPAPVLQDQDLFRTGSSPQHPLELHRAGAPQRRQGRHHPADSVAGKSTPPSLTKSAGMSRSKDKASVVNYGDHEVIVPENRLRSAVSDGPDSNEDPVARDEKALAALSPEFGAWMDSECDRLDGARREILDSGFTDTNKE